jgi:hypothetical protein
MYMKPEVQKKVFAEAYRVMKPGARWLVWEAVIPPALENDTRGPAFRFTFHLPKEKVQTGYGTLWPEQPLDVSYYRALAQATGFRVANVKEQGGGFRTLFMELKKG